MCTIQTVLSTRCKNLKTSFENCGISLLANHCLLYILLSKETLLIQILNFFFGRRPLPFGGSPLEAYPRTSGESNHHRQSVSGRRVPPYQLSHDDTSDSNSKPQCFKTCLVSSLFQMLLLLGSSYFGTASMIPSHATSASLKLPEPELHCFFPSNAFMAFARSFNKFVLAGN